MKKHNTDRSQEIVRLGVVSLFVIFLMVIERQLFSQGIIALGVRRDSWVMENFTPAAIIVWLVSVISAGAWYVTALRSNISYDPARDHQTMLFKWVGFFFLPLFISICVALSFHGDADSTAFPWFLGFLLMDTVLIYWGSSAISTPGLLEYMVPGSEFLRKLLFIDKK